MSEHSHLWLRLDNAAKLYPAVRNKKWSNVFRLSVTLTKPVDPVVLQSALAVTIRRFPTMAMRLRHGFFWYYLEAIPKAPPVQPDLPYPCNRMTLADIKTCAFRVLYYENRIAVEFFHSLTDGNGALIFLKTLTAEYLLQKEQLVVPCEQGVLSRQERPSHKESEDSFLKYEGSVSGSRREATTYRLHGTPEPDGFRNVITGIVELPALLAIAKFHHVSLTALLAAVMVDSIQQIQNRETPVKHRQKPIKVLIPVNLRHYFESKSFRNFVLYVTPGIDANLGDFSLDEIIQSVYHQMQVQLTQKQMQAKITANVRAEKNRFLKVLPLFVKNLGMKLMFSAVGEKKSCITMSNLGRAVVPKQMAACVERFDFTLGTQNTCPHNCGIISYEDKLYINMIRSITESELERIFFTNLRKLGVAVKVESNQKG